MYKQIGGIDMAFIEEMKQKAKSNLKTIVLPEATDVRVLEATQMVLQEKYANIILVGEKEKIEKLAKEKGFSITGATIVEPATSSKKEEYANAFYELRKAKGMTE